MSCILKASGKRLIVKEIKEEAKPGALILPDAAETFEAVIAAVGDDVSKNIGVLDVVILKRMSGFPFDFGGEEFLSVMEQEIIAIVSGVKSAHG